MTKSKIKSRPKPKLTHAASGALGMKLKVGALTILLGIFAWQTIAIAKLKTSQRVRMVPAGALVPQGEGDGKISNVVGVEVGSDGKVFVMSVWPKGIQLQRYSPDMVFEMARWIDPVTKGKKAPQIIDPTALAISPVNTIYVAQKDGKIITLDTDFRFKSALKLDMTELQDLEILGNGDLLVLDRLARRLRVHHPDGKLVSEFGSKKMISPKRLTLSSSGMAVVLDEVGGRYVLKVFSADNKFSRSVIVQNVAPSGPNQLGAGANDGVILNDSHGVRGVLFYDVARGIFVGESLGASSGEPFLNPGFVSGDRRQGTYFLHFGPGLQKARLPLE